MSETWNPWTYKNDDALAVAVPSMVGKDAYGLLMRACEDARVVRVALGNSTTGLAALNTQLDRIEAKLDELLSR